MCLSAAWFHFRIGKQSTTRWSCHYWPIKEAYKDRRNSNVGEFSARTCICSWFPGGSKDCLISIPVSSVRFSQCPDRARTIRQRTPGGCPSCITCMHTTYLAQFDFSLTSERTTYVWCNEISFLPTTLKKRHSKKSEWLPLMRAKWIPCEA